MDEMLDVISKYVNDKIKRKKIGQIVKSLPQGAAINITDEDMSKYKDMAVEDYFALRKVEKLVEAEIIEENTAERLKSSINRRTMLNERLADIYLNEKDKKEVENIEAELVSIENLLNSFHLLDNPFNPAVNDTYNIINEYSRLWFAAEDDLVITIIDSFEIKNWDDDLIDKKMLTENRARKYFYLNHINTPEEQRKTDSLLKRLYEFVTITDGEKGIPDFKDNTPATICYRENVGYIGIPNDSNHVLIYYYGNSEEQAFLNILNSYEWNLSSYRTDIRNEMFYGIHPGSKAIPIDCRENRSQSAIMQFRKFYGDNIPEIIIKSLSKWFEIPVKYDYNKHYFVRAEKNPERKLKPEGDN